MTSLGTVPVADDTLLLSMYLPSPHACATPAHPSGVLITAHPANYPRHPGMGDYTEHKPSRIPRYSPGEARGTVKSSPESSSGLSPPSVPEAENYFLPESKKIFSQSAITSAYFGQGGVVLNVPTEVRIVTMTLLTPLL